MQCRKRRAIRTVQRRSECVCKGRFSGPGSNPASANARVEAQHRWTRHGAQIRIPAEASAREPLPRCKRDGSAKSGVSSPRGSEGGCARTRHVSEQVESDELRKLLLGGELPHLPPCYVHLSRKGAKRDGSLGTVQTNAAELLRAYTRKLGVESMLRCLNVQRGAERR